MEYLPRKTLLGELKVCEIYESYEGPKLFCASNDLGSKYLAYWCEQGDDFYRWLYLPVSGERLDEIKRQKVSLNAAYSSPEEGIFVVCTPFSKKDDTVEFFQSLKKDDPFLPPNDECLLGDSSGWKTEDPEKIWEIQGKAGV